MWSWLLAQVSERPVLSRCVWTWMHIKKSQITRQEKKAGVTGYGHIYPFSSFPQIYHLTLILLAPVCKKPTTQLKSIALCQYKVSMVSLSLSTNLTFVFLTWSFHTIFLWYRPIGNILMALILLHLGTLLLTGYLTVLRMRQGFKDIALCQSCQWSNISYSNVQGMSISPFFLL